VKSFLYFTGLLHRAASPGCFTGLLSAFQVSACQHLILQFPWPVKSVFDTSPGSFSECLLSAFRPARPRCHIFLDTAQEILKLTQRMSNLV